MKLSFILGLAVFSLLAYAGALPVPPAPVVMALVTKPEMDIPDIDLWART